MATNKIQNDFRPPEHIFDSGDAIQNYIAWRDSEIARRINDPADDYWPWTPENFCEALCNKVETPSEVLTFGALNMPVNLGVSIIQIVNDYWVAVLRKNYDEKSGVM
jgi:hypothetical protein